jgi:hypothetical protein
MKLNNGQNNIISTIEEVVSNSRTNNESNNSNPRVNNSNNISNSRVNSTSNTTMFTNLNYNFPQPAFNFQGNNDTFNSNSTGNNMNSMNNMNNMNFQFYNSNQGQGRITYRNNISNTNSNMSNNNFNSELFNSFFGNMNQFFNGFGVSNSGNYNNIFNDVNNLVNQINSNPNRNTTFTSNNNLSQPNTIPSNYYDLPEFQDEEEIDEDYNRIYHEIRTHAISQLARHKYANYLKLNRSKQEYIFILT